MYIPSSDIRNRHFLKAEPSRGLTGATSSPRMPKAHLSLCWEIPGSAAESPRSTGHLLPKCAMCPRAAQASLQREGLHDAAPDLVIAVHNKNIAPILWCSSGEPGRVETAQEPPGREGVTLGGSCSGSTPIPMPHSYALFLCPIPMPPG